jgi:hypothetical protein
LASLPSEAASATATLDLGTPSTSAIDAAIAESLAATLSVSGA